jgi:fatty-acyl-CoA synthase
MSALARATLRPERPDRLPRAIAALAVAGPTLAGAAAAATARYPLAPAVIDDHGGLTYSRLWQESDAVARKLRASGIGPGHTVGLLHRNHRGFLISLVAAAKLGADIVYLNTAFAPPQMAAVVEGEGIDVVLHDDEDHDAVAGTAARLTLTESEMHVLGRRRALVPLVPSRHVGRTVILTSGTTGRPKGARRSGTGSPDALTPLLSTIPIRARDTVMIAAPLFHAWGLSHLGVGMGLSSTAIVQRHFDAEGVLALIDAHRPAGLVVVPVMLQRILALGGETIARYDTSSLRYIASSGSALAPALVTEVLRRFGPILYNVYGSTEVALATIATPDDLRDAPGTAGRRAASSEVRILDDAGQPVPVGEVGRIFVGSGSRFDGYTDGGGKENIGGLLASGDVGHFDADGLLYIDGRDDDMIVSGGENVFPAEVEDLLAAHPDVAEAAVVGVPDDEFGQRLKAIVVRRPGASLSAADVKAHVRSQLARYKVPGTVEFVDALPRTVTGKLRRKDLS